MWVRDKQLMMAARLDFGHLPMTNSVTMCLFIAVVRQDPPVRAEVPRSRGGAVLPQPV